MCGGLCAVRRARDADWYALTGRALPRGCLTRLMACLVRQAPGPPHAAAGSQRCAAAATVALRTSGCSELATALPHEAFVRRVGTAISGTRGHCVRLGTYHLCGDSALYICAADRQFCDDCARLPLRTICGGKYDGACLVCASPQ